MNIDSCELTPSGTYKCPSEGKEFYVRNVYPPIQVRPIAPTGLLPEVPVGLGVATSGSMRGNHIRSVLRGRHMRQLFGAYDHTRYRFGAQELENNDQAHRQRYSLHWRPVHR